MRNKRFNQLKLVAALGVITSLVFAGGISGASGRHSDAKSKSPIVIGQIYSAASFLGAGFGGNPPEVMADWVKMINNSGGINGYPVKLYSINDESDPAQALQAAKTLVQKDHVMAVVGEYSTLEVSFASYLQAAGVPVVGGEPNNPPMWTNADFFPTGAGAVTTQAGEVLALQQLGKSKLGYVYCAEAPVCATLNASVKSIAALTKVQATYSGEIAATSPNFDATCEAMQSAGVDSYAVAGTGAEVSTVVEDCTQLGFSPTVIINAPEALAQWAPEAWMNGTYLIAPNANPYTSNQPGVRSFRLTMDKYSPGFFTNANFSEASEYVWTGGALFAAAAKAAKITPKSKGADVKKGLYMLKNETLGGISPPLNFVKGKPTFVSCWFQEQLQGGNFVTDNSGKYSCIPSSILPAVKQIANG